MPKRKSPGLTGAPKKRARNKGPWRQRMVEFATEHCPKADARLLDTPEQWEEGTKLHRQKYKPRLLCIKAGCACGGEAVTSTNITNLVSRRQMGCSGRTAVPWSKRMDEFATEHCPKADARLRDTPEQWEEGTKRHGKEYTPRLLCIKAGCACGGEAVTSTTIKGLVSDGRLGCSGRTKVPWTARMVEFATEHCPKADAKLLDTPEQWEEGTKQHGKYHTPHLLCTRAGCRCGGEAVTSTTIDGLVSNGRLGCSGRTCVPWTKRMDEFATEHCPKADAELRDTPEQWEQGTKLHRQNYMPSLLCTRAGCRCGGETVTSTTINNLVAHAVLGCSGRTAGVVEGLVRRQVQAWLLEQHGPEWTLGELTGYRLRYAGRDRVVQVDFALRHRGVLRGIMEKDGPHHFGPFSYGGPPLPWPELVAAFLHKAARDCAVNLHYYKVRGVAVGRFHYDSPPACVAFMQAFINDVVAREGDAPPLLRVSDATKYNGIVATVTRLTPPPPWPGPCSGR